MQNNFLLLLAIASACLSLISAKVVTVKIVRSSFYETNSDLRTILVSIDEAPQKMDVLLSLSKAGSSVFPTVLKYELSSSVTFPREVAFIAGASGAGTYQLQVTLDGISANEYTVEYFGGLNEITVLSSSQEPPAPVANSARFANDGSSIFVSFDSNTDRGGFSSSFPCGDLLDFPFSSSALCNWADSSRIEIFGTSYVMVGTSITIRGGKILPHCEYMTCVANKVAQTSLSVDSPSDPILPIVSISTSTTIGGCNSIKLDLSGSSGSGGRPWKSISFVVTSTHTASATAIENWLALNYQISPPSSIANSFLEKGHSYTFTVSMTNFLRTTASASVTVNVKQDTSIPVASIVGQQVRSIVSTDVLSLSTNAYTASCAGSDVTTTSAGLTYDWSVSHNGNKLSIVSEAKDTSKFKLSSHKLSSGKTYDVTVKVTNKAGSIATASTSVTVTPADILAIIDGGSQRTVNNGDDFSVVASSSIDQDSGSSVGLTYSWTCFRIYPAIGDCALGATFEKKSSQEFTTSDSAVGSVNRVTVIVTGTGERMSTKFVDITVASAGSPEVAITTSSKSLTSLNPSKSVVLNGVVSLKGDSCDATWTMNGADINPSNALTPVYTTVPSGIARTISLVLAPNVLPQRSEFVFSLTCKDTVSSISVTTNGPPLPGTFSITPDEGTELKTMFMFSAKEWSDPDLPITYMFGFTANSGDMIVQGRSELSFGESVLPSGLPMKCNAVIYDSLGSFSKISATTSVTPASAANLQASIESQLASLGSNPDATKQTLSTASAALNQVDCSGTSCAAVNRAECSKTAKTCGVCLTGYIGDAGDKNSMCVEANTPFPDVSKTCDNDCSSQGTCLLISTDTGLTVDECKAGDSTCEAFCECDDGYAGASCSSTVAEVDAKQSIRSSLIDSLSSLSQNEDASTDTVVTWASSLSALTQNVDEISPVSAASAQNVASMILSGASSSGVSFDAINNVLAVVDASTTATISAARRRRRLLAKRGLSDDASVVAAENLVVDASIAKSVELLGMYGSLVSSQLYPGQDSVTNVLNTFRLSTEVFASDGSDITASTPLTDAEIASGVVASSVALTPSSTGGALKVTTVMTTAKSFGDLGNSFNSNSMHLQLEGGSTDAEVIIVLQNTAPVVFNHIESTETFEYSCRKGEISSNVRTCSDSGFTFNFECHGWVDFMNATCPSQTEQPKCNILDISGVESANSCRMVSYTDTSTTCACTIVPGSGRRLNALDDSGVTDLVAMSAFVTNQFAGTLSTPPTFSSWADLKKVMIVLLMYGIFWATGLGLISLCIVKRWASQSKEREERAALAKQKELAGKLRSPVVIREYLTEYVNSVFPDVFRAKPFLTRMYNEVTKNHRYIYLLTSSGKGSDAGRMLTGIQLLTTQAMLMFLMAVFYELEGPDDDGSCPYFDTESTCLARASLFDHTQTYCAFNSVTSLCTYKEPEFSWKSIALIGTLIAFATCVFSSPIDYLFNVLSAPTILDKSKVGQTPALLDAVGVQVDATTSLAKMTARDRFRKAMTNPNFTALAELRDLPAETEDAYVMAKASMSVVNAMATANKNARASLMSDMREQANGSNFFNGALHDIQDVDDDDLKCDPTDTFAKLTDDINCQRRVMKFSQLDDFDDEWGLDPTGSFTRKTDFQFTKCATRTIDTEEILRNELKFVEEETRIKTEKLKYANEKHIGLEMLHIFVLDLLGHNSTAAKIFIAKSEEDYRFTKAVSAKAKGFAWLGVIMINLFFVYYSMMTGMIRGKSWQYAYLAGCVGQIIFEVVIAETFEILWVHFIIPNLVAAEVKQVWAKIMDTIERLTTVEASDVTYVIDAPQYLFVSTNLAKAFPHLPESSIISAYHNHLPGEMASKWHVDRVSLMGLNGANNTWIRFLTFTTIVTILKFLGASPFVIQRMIMRITSPLFTAAAVFMWMYIITSPIYMSLFGCVVLAFIARAYYNYKSQLADIKGVKTQKKSAIAPIVEEKKSSNEDGIEFKSISA